MPRNPASARRDAPRPARCPAEARASHATPASGRRAPARSGRTASRARHSSAPLPPLVRTRDFGTAPPGARAATGPGRAPGLRSSCSLLHLLQNRPCKFFADAPVCVGGVVRDRVREFAAGNLPAQIHHAAAAAFAEALRDFLRRQRRGRLILRPPFVWAVR